MKYFLILTTLFVFLVSCTTYQIQYDIGLKQVERPVDAKERFGEQKIDKIEEEESTNYYFEDSVVKIIWIPSPQEFDFVLINKSTYSIKIIWDEAVFVNENGISHRVIHSGIRYIDRENPKPPSVVPGGATIKDLVYPTDYVYYSSGVGWRRRPLLPVMTGVSEEDLSSKAKEYIGKTYKILLPLLIEGVINEYVFTFKVDDAKVEVYEPSF